MTVRYAEVIGDPIVQSKSPLIHNFWLRKLGVEGEYRARSVTPKALERHIELAYSDRAWLGCNVTSPHKQTIMPFLDRIAASAEAVGAVNIVGREGTLLVGMNSDVAGVQAAIGRIPDGCGVCLIGTGGAARAALAALRQRNIGAIHLLARNPGKGQALLDEFGLPGASFHIDSASSAMGQASLVINASLLGMGGKAPMPPVLLAALDDTHPDALVFDMVYDPLDTALLAATRRRGRRAVDGLVMLVGQARSAFRHFFGAEAPDDAESNSSLRSMLTAA